MRILICLVCTLSCSFLQAQECEHVNCTVTIKSDDSYGSGVVFKNKSRTFIWTAAHTLVDGKIDSTSYADVWVTSPIFETGRKVGEDRRLARVIRFNLSEDIAVLEVRQKNWGTSTTFADANYIPVAGNPVWHVGAFEGRAGENSVSDGVIAAVGRLRRGYVMNETDNPFVFDQVSMVAHHGSSGGGIFDKKTGKCLGLVTEFLTKNSPGSFCVVPSRRLHEFSKRTSCEWAIDLAFETPQEIEPEIVEPIIPQPIPARPFPVTPAVQDIIFSIIKSFKEQK